MGWREDKEGLIYILFLKGAGFYTDGRGALYREELSMCRTGRRSCRVKGKLADYIFNMVQNCVAPLQPIQTQIKDVSGTVDVENLNISGVSPFNGRKVISPN